jgi:methionyl-tRNA synthetase
VRGLTSANALPYDEKFTSVAEKFYITTPIYYVNARPHMGHAYTTVVCDALARWHRMHGVDTYFLTGTDEHGVNVERSAAAAGAEPQKWVDVVAAEYRALWDRMGISYDDFIRTTEPRHARGVQEIFRKLQLNGWIYKGSYSGQYCVFDNLYVDVDTPGAPCPECGRPTETIREENYFFKLSAFENKLLEHFQQHPEFIWPETRRNEVVSFVRSGLRDLSISRSREKVKWGIPVPDDPGQVIYVWLDALCNYITALGYGSGDQEKFQRYWPADAHVMSKEIVRFHCVYWPAFLMGAGVPLPRSVIVHGWLLFEENKMSKSRGNIVRASSVIDVLGNDALRYFLLREVAFGQDGSFSFDALVQRYNSDLANDLGNLASRVLTMIDKYFRGEAPYPSPAAAHETTDDEIARLAKQTIVDFNQNFKEYQLSRAIEAVWLLIRAVNKYLVETAPWVVAEKQDEISRSRLATILYTAAEALRISTALMHPVIPGSTAKIWQQLGAGDISPARLDRLKWGELPLGTRIGEIAPVFPRADKSAITAMQEKEAEADRAKASAGVTRMPPEKVESDRQSAQPSRAEAGGAAHGDQPAGTHAQAGQRATQSAKGPAEAAPAAAAAPQKITIDDFTKVELRVAQVKVAEKVQGADRLLRLEVDLGYETRQIVAGIAKAYDPEKLVGRKIVIVANLQPRKLRGLESNGMLLAASVGDEGVPVLAGFLEDVPVGAKLK